MAAESKKEIGLEIGHVLFVDIIGYSKLLINEQSEQLQTLKEIVRATERFRSAEAAGKLLRLPTGDGGALVFRTTPDAPVLCALEVSKALKSHPELRVRMGIHSGPVNEIIDLNEQANIAGAGINIAQRVMDCGDAGHILLSRHVAEDLEQYPRWRAYLHDLGECEVKHGVRIGIANLYDGEVGNAQLPKKLEAVKRHRTHLRLAAGAIALLVVAALAAAVLSFLRKEPARSIATAVEKSIAVLPFENHSQDAENAYFADGVQDDILAALSKIDGLKVISRTSTVSYRAGANRNLRAIAQELGVAHILEGSVRRAGGKVRVTTQLIDARSDAHLWADTYDRDLADVFAIQSDIALQVAAQLRAKLSPSERAAIERPVTADLAAFDLYTRAKTTRLMVGFGPLYKDRLLEAVKLLDLAVARDPGFFAAWCELATIHDNLYFAGYDQTPARLGLAENAVQTALRLDPDAGAAHLARAQHLYNAYRDYGRARTELETAKRTLPNSAEIAALTGYIDRRQGRWTESTVNLERAIDLDPRNWFTLSEISVNYSRLRRYARANAVSERAAAIVPKDVLIRVNLGWIASDWKADLRPLHATIQAILAEDPAAAGTVAGDWLFLALCERDLAMADRALAALKSDDALSLGHMLLQPAFGVGLVARVRGNAAEARTAFTTARIQQEEAVRAQPENAPALCALGLIDAALGRKEEALREGRRALDLLPVQRDALAGADLIVGFAIICAWTGENDLALEQLTIAARIPSLLNYGQLKLHPWWDPLRGDARFENLVASLAPKFGENE